MHVNQRKEEETILITVKSGNKKKIINLPAHRRVSEIFHKQKTKIRIDGKIENNSLYIKELEQKEIQKILLLIGNSTNISF